MHVALIDKREDFVSFQESIDPLDIYLPRVFPVVDDRRSRLMSRISTDLILSLIVCDLLVVNQLSIRWLNQDLGKDDFDSLPLTTILSPTQMCKTVKRPTLPSFNLSEVSPEYE
jgi:hypothetical protein